MGCLGTGLAAVGLVWVGTAYACTSSNLMTVNPASLSAGNSAIVTGQSFSPDPTASPVVVRLDSPTGPVLWSGRPNTGGNFSFNFSVAQSEAPGDHILLATQTYANGKGVGFEPTRALMNVTAPPPVVPSPGPQTPSPVQSQPATPAPAVQSQPAPATAASAPSPPSPPAPPTGTSSPAPVQAPPAASHVPTGVVPSPAPVPAAPHVAASPAAAPAAASHAAPSPAVPSAAGHHAAVAPSAANSHAAALQQGSSGLAWFLLSLGTAGFGVAGMAVASLARSRPSRALRRVKIKR